MRHKSKNELHNNICCSSVGRISADVIRQANLMPVYALLNRPTYKIPAFARMTSWAKMTTLAILASCSISASAFAAEKPHTVTISQNIIRKTLYYNGVVAPIVNVPVISPTAGVIAKMNFQYGQMVKKNQNLLTVTSTKVLESLRSAKVAYLNALQAYNQTKNWSASSTYINAEDSLSRARRTYTQAHNNYEENIHLYKLGIISKNQLDQSINTYKDDKSSLDESKRSFKKIKAKGTGDYLLIKKLQYEAANDKYQSFLKQVSSKTIKAPAGGIVLIPTQSDSNSSSSSSNNNTTSGKLQVGSTITYQQVLMNIGDMSGLKISFSVPEIDINKLKVNQKATITGSGFPGIMLKGIITSVGAQASSQGSGGGSLPSFPVIVHVAKLSKAASKLIRSGMDAQVAIDISKKQKGISVPVSAVHQAKNKTSYVIVYNPNTEKSQKVSVTTGIVGTSNVEITNGLKIGEQVVTGKGK